MKRYQLPLIVIGIAAVCVAGASYGDNWQFQQHKPAAQIKVEQYHLPLKHVTYIAADKEGYQWALEEAKRAGAK